MSKNKRKRHKNSRKSRPPPNGIVLLGARIPTPMYLEEEQAFGVLELWMELPSETIVHHDVGVGSPEAVSNELRSAVEAIGPKRIRIADAAWAAQVRAEFPDVAVTVGPTPQLDALAAQMLGSIAGGEPLPYLTGDVDAATTEEMFRAAELFYIVKPWQFATDDQVLRVDIPALGVFGACISVIGALGESYGFIVFPSIEGYERFLLAAPTLPDSQTLDIGTSMLSLNYERGAELPAVMRMEIDQHGWPVADATAYPVIEHRERDGMPRPITNHDIRVIAHCTSALTAMFVKHSAWFENPRPAPMCESYFDSNDVEVRITVPADAGPLFEANALLEEAHDQSDFFAAPAAGTHPEPARRKIGRNEMCPCGSGKKYKRCCLHKDETLRRGPPQPHPLHALDQALTQRMLDFAAARWGDVFFELLDDLIEAEFDAMLVVPFGMYHLPVEAGKTLAEWFVQEKGRSLSRRERTWMEAQRTAWLSLWEVRAVRPGQTMELADVLTGEVRTVHDVQGSTNLRLRSLLLARVVDAGQTHLLSGSHPMPLDPLAGFVVQERVRGYLRRKSAIDPARLREAKVGRYMIRRWSEMREALLADGATSPRLENTEGDSFVVTVDRFVFEQGRRGEVEQKLLAIAGMHAEPESGAYVWLGEASGTVLGSVTIGDATLRIETNSVERADRLSDELDGACGGLLTHRGRSVEDPFVLAENQPLSADADEDDIPPEIRQRITVEFKERHYADWLDDPIPALDGATPREASQSKQGRARVTALINNIEFTESDAPEGHRFDVGVLRRELRLA